MTAQDRADLEAWLAEDRRNRGALLRAQAALHLMEEAVARGAPELRHSGNDTVYGSPSPKRFGRIAIAAGLAGVLAAGVAMFALLGRPSAGEHRIHLADGSVVTLQDDAEITSEITAGLRSITLLSGEARFKVAKDPTRPFVVRAGEVRAQATGTVYSVSRVGSTGARVDVQEGSVLVWAREGQDQAVLLRAGGKLTLEPGVSAGSSAPEADVAQIALDNDTIDVAVARFNRLNHTQIIVDDARIGGVRIIGLFNANDPLVFARAAAAVSGGRVVQQGDRIVIEAR